MACIGGIDAAQEAREARCGHASDSLTGPARVYTTRLATVVVHVGNPGVRGYLLGGLVHGWSGR